MKHACMAGLAPVLVACAGPAFARSNQDIVVIGEKSARALQETTSSVAVQQRQDIDAQDLRSLSDVIERSANVAPVYGSAGFSIRGIANIGVSGAGEAATANVYIDDIPLASTFLHAAPTDMWDVAQVEIWRGPQSTLRGQNALAGAIVIQSADPRIDRWDMSGRALLSDEGERGIAFAGGGPIVAGTLGVRIAAERDRRDGVIRNTTRRAFEDAESRDMIRAKVLWQPQSWPGFSLKLGYTHFRRAGGYYTVYARTDVPDYLDRRIATDNTPNTTDVDLDGVTAEARYELHPGLALVSETTWSGVHEVSRYDGDYGPENLAFAAQQRRYRTFTQEFRVSLRNDRLSGVAGVYFFDRNLASYTQSRTSVPTPTGPLAQLLAAAGLSPLQAQAITSAYGNALPAITVDFDGSFPTKIRTAAVFGDLHYRLSGRLSLLAGVRVDRYVGSDGTIQQAIFAGHFPDPSAFGPIAPVIAQINAAVGRFVTQVDANLPGARRKITAILPKAGLLIDWNDRIATSFVAQRGYRPGGVSINIARGQAVPYDPEYVWNFELSQRMLLAGGRIRLNANAYYALWRNQQISVNFGLNSYDVNTANAARSHIYGFEVESAVQFERTWSFFASAGYSRTKFDHFDALASGTTQNLVGTEFAFAPHWTLNGGIQGRMKCRIAGSLSARYTSGSFSAIGPEQSRYAVAAHTDIDAKLGYDGEHWSTYLVVRNLLDDNYIVYKSPAEHRAVLSAPRTFVIEMNLRY